MLIGATFANQIVKAEWDGTLNSTILSDGVLRGCLLSNTSSTVTIGDGILVVAGRIIPNIGNHIVSISSPPNGFMRIYLQIDLGAMSTESTFEQISLVTDYASTTTFPALIKNDINSTGTIYQYEIGVWSVTSGNIVSLERNNLDKASKDSRLFPFTLTPSGWTGTGPYLQSITIPGIIATDRIIPSLIESASMLEEDAYDDGVIRGVGHINNVLTFRAKGDKPTINLPMQVLVIK
jgi:hypothetical protein